MSLSLEVHCCQFYYGNTNYHTFLNFTFIIILSYRFGFFLDPTSLPQDSDVLTAQYESMSTNSLISHFYIHYSGTALVQPTCDMDRDQSIRPENLSPEKGEEKVSVPHSSAVDINTVEREGSDREGLFSMPIGSSTPTIESSSLLRSNESNVYGWERIKCGFYWYKNHLYLRQKNTSATMHEQCDKLLAQLTSFCSDENRELSDLCATIVSKYEDMD